MAKNKKFTLLLPKQLAIIVVTLLVALSFPLTVAADRFDEQIRAIQNEVAGYQNEAGRLQAQADTLQNKVNVLNAQKRAIQAQIDLNQAKFEQLTNQITETERKIEEQKNLLASTLRAMYVEDSVTPLEMVASSKSISDFIDKAEYRNKIRDKIQQSLKDIRTLKDQLIAQKTEVERVLADQKTQRATLAAQEAEQANLLAETQGQEAAYQQIIGQKNSQIATLRAEQAAANRRIGGGAAVVPGDPGHGGYPNVWHNAPMNSFVDNWGMYSRQCVSYTAFRVSNSGRYMPYWGGHGNANQWPGSAQADGIATGSTPKVGAVAISMAGFYGHAMYVEAVLNGGSTIHVSQYNYGWDGEYNEMTISASGLVYIYF